MNRLFREEAENPEGPNSLCRELIVLLGEYCSQKWFEENEEFLNDPAYLTEAIINILETIPPSEGVNMFRKMRERKLQRLIVCDNFDEEVKNYISEWGDSLYLMGKCSLDQEKLCSVLMHGLSQLSHQELLNLSMSLDGIAAIKGMWENSHENIMFSKAWRFAFFEMHPEAQLLDEVFDEHREELKRIFPDRHSSN